MSETVSTSPGLIASILRTLDAQQAHLSEADRGLGPNLAQLIMRLAKNPALEHDPRFGTEVAWLVQDWQTFSGTSEAPRISPILQAGLRTMASEIPGLQNEDIKALLTRTGDVADRSLVRDIREKALELAALSPEEQNSIQAAKTVGILEYRVNQAMQSSEQTAHSVSSRAPAPSAPDQQTTSRGAQSGSRDEQRGAAAEPPATVDTRQRDAGTTDAQGQSGSATNGQPNRGQDQRQAATAAQNEADLSVAARAQAGPGGRPSEEPEDDAARPRTGGQTPAGGQRRENAPAAAQNERPSAAQANPGAQHVADAVAQVVGGTVASLSGVAQGIRRGVADHLSSTRQQSDRRHIDHRVDELRAANRKAEADLANLREQGRPFFQAFDKAVEQAGGNAGQVIADMAPGRPHESLRQNLDDALANTPAFSEAWTQLRSSTAALGKQVEYLRVDADRRDLSSDETVVSGEQAAAKTGWHLKNLPGTEPGRNFLEEASRFVEMLVERLHNFLSQVFGRREERDNSPSPGR